MLAEISWTDKHFLRTLAEEKLCTQFGALKGIISGENIQETEVNMACTKNRCNGRLESQELMRYLTLFVYTENGHILYFGVKSKQNGCQRYKFGYVLMHSGIVHPLQNTDLEIDILEKYMSDLISIQVNVNNQLLKISLSMKRNETVKFINNDCFGYKSENIPAEGNVNGHKAKAILFHWHSYEGSNLERLSPVLSHLRIEKCPEIYVTKIGSEESKIMELAGGKGSSLGLMKSLNNEEICIPDGFIITSYAFQQQIDSNSQLKQALLKLEDIAFGKMTENLENACMVTEELFGEQIITPIVEEAIQEAVMDFTKSIEEKIIPYLRVAVRSSAIYEDSEGFSSAGQNQTFLGCQTSDVLFKKICRCWGSLFSYQSVIYRRQHGLPIKTSMAVVVQIMIPAEVAGVLFTCHPSTMNPSQMMITSNFGLGETVVSGQVEPDTIIISKSFDGEIRFHSYCIGSKKYTICLEENGMFKKELSSEKSKCQSLSEKNVLKLAKVGVILEKAFGGPRDIEWAIFEVRTFYILQSRAITTFNQWTDYELLHEFDTPHLSNDTFYTRANIGEVLPFALTPLSQSTVVDGTEKGYQICVFGKYNPFASLSIVFSHHYGMIDILGGLYSKPRRKVEIASTMIDLAVFGHPVLDDDLNAKAIARYGILSTKELTAAHYSDLALILSTCDDVISAEVPTRLAEIVEVLRNNNLSEKFTFVDPVEGVAWLRCNCKSAYELFQDFITVHGHRLLGEFELSLNSWEMDPSAVIKMIQVNCKVSKTVRKFKDIETNIIDKLVCPEKFVTKKILSYLIDKYRSAVGNREKSKSALVKLMNKLRIAYRSLAVEMTRQGFIPAESLIFHLTHNEIKEVIHRKNPSLVMKAAKRQKLYPSWNKLKFPEIISGMPIPDVENEANFVISDTDVCINGTVVCFGEVFARACVISSLDEINELEEGDILITISTDIGWSPYFPILSGIVTELGGLMSHGAVVAREYGLPCIVGAKNATRVLRTGNRVFLSGKLGTLRLLQN
ncbi:hypothetical protein WA026_011143 [Henosepilachna vigintioctopunctata]|uniref:Phosphoenolpyruvate synthase n=1 Tax=Henosepilachna vigintioctopunctata TaxID=420089 RepID=A0AAW1TWR3_9CUCU